MVHKAYHWYHVALATCPKALNGGGWMDGGGRGEGGGGRGGECDSK